MRYSFDAYVLDVPGHELRRGTEPVPVEPKVFDLLLYLIENRARAIPKEEIVGAVWDGRAISDATLSSAVKAARKAVGDDGQRQHAVKTLHGHGFRFVSPVTEYEPDSGGDPGTDVEQEIYFCHSTDGTRLAYAVAGSGPPLVKAANWLNHLEYDWESPLWRHFFQAMARRNRLVRFDARGNGLSDWDVCDYSLARQVEDLEAVVEADGLERFDLLGVSQGCAKAIAYAVRHPDRVRKMVLLGGYAVGWRQRNVNAPSFMGEATVEMIRKGWGQDNPAVRNMFTTVYLPDAPPESQRWFADLQKITAPGENAANILSAHGDTDVRPLLGQVTAQCLVIHSRNDAGVPYSEGQTLAAGIPGARFVTLETRNRILPLSDPAWSRAERAISAFLHDDGD